MFLAKYFHAPWRPWLRHPHTTQEMRMSYAAPCYPEDVPHSEIRGRAGRNPHLLPNTYDDIFIHYEKCWKSLRKTKYKKIKPM